MDNFLNLPTLCTIKYSYRYCGVQHFSLNFLIAHSPYHASKNSSVSSKAQLSCPSLQTFLDSGKNHHSSVTAKDYYNSTLPPFNQLKLCMCQYEHVDEI